MTRFAAMILSFALLLYGVLGASTATAQQTVGSVSALREALSAPASNAVILLEPGDYGVLQLRGLRGGVTLRSADPSDMARFSGLLIEDVESLTLDRLAFYYRFSPDDIKEQQSFRVANSRDITISGSVFTGDMARSSNAADNGYPSGTGLIIR